MKIPSNSCILVSSLELIEDYPVLHPQIDPIKTKLTEVISSILFRLKYQDEVDEVTDEFIFDSVQPYLAEDIQAIYISDKAIIGSIKEYLYHLFVELGGIKNLTNIQSIIFSGSLNATKHVIIDLVKPKPNVTNVLIGV